MVVAPPARAPRIAALASSAISLRDRPYSAPLALSWSSPEMPLMPSMSTEMYTDLPDWAGRAATAPAQQTKLNRKRLGMPETTPA